MIPRDIESLISNLANVIDLKSVERFFNQDQQQQQKLKNC